ncbi:Transcriptional activator CadC [Pseudoalteromonas sp. P1-9]|uniref:winged helix-turn-helix domain-containing protein n=1 Tax=Pseudoalteromonas sp. P1-9 TaxID=1710354 RepID=UPI0006D5E079|nr:winged helix-turn-helix domain-containing protein [Pseudoalteromonas sp. P1-9]KPV94706.1 Transcriptional activator CadC [Pseudoalteromonas sp. P1-9]
MRTFYIADFKVEPEKNKVSLPKAEFRLEPRVMSILCYLVKHQGEVLSKEQILAALWPNQSLEPELVTKAVFEIRKILNDNPKTPRVIETIPRKGYIFIGKINIKERKLSTANISLVGVFACIVAAFLYTNNTQRNGIDLSNVPTKKIIRHSVDGEITSISVNNNNHLLFTHKENSSSSLYLHNNTTLKNTKLETPLTEIKDIFSTKGSDYILNCNDACSIFKREKDNYTPILKINERIIKVSVSPNEKWLALQITKHHRHNIALVSIEEKDAKIFYLPHNGSEQHPVFANDNSLYYISQTSDRKTYLANYNLDTRQTTTKPLPIDRVSGLSFYTDSKYVITGRYNGQYALWLLTIDPLSLSVIANIDPQQKVIGIAVDHKTKTIHYAIQNRPITIQSKGALSTKIEHPSINLDGKYLSENNAFIFNSNRSGSYEIWLESQDQLSKLTNINASYIHSIKVDNSQSLIALSYTKNKTKHIAVYSLLRNTIIFDVTTENDSYLLNFDHTSTNLYISERAAENYDLLSLNIENHTVSKVALDAGIATMSDANGIYYYSFSNQALQYQTNLGATDTLYDFENKALQIRASSIKLTKEGFFYLSKINKQQVISFYNFNSKTTKPLFMMKPNQFVTDFGFINSLPYIIFDEDADVTSQIISLELVN